MQRQLPKNRDYGVNTCPGCLEKQREIDRLKDENQRLKAVLRYRQRKQADGPFGSSTPSSQIVLKPNSKPENKAKPGGAIKGHTGHGRQATSPQQADCIKDVALSAPCPHCGGELLSKGSRQRTVIDIDAVEVQEILYRLERKLCCGCGRTLQAQPPGVLAKSALGNQLLTELLDGHYLQGIPLSRLCANFRVNLGTVIDALHRLAALLQPALKPLVSEYRLAPVRHADETRWRTDGQSGYCWLFATTEVSLYLFRRTRSASVVKEGLGDKPLEGVLVVDRYAAYNHAPCALQYCYAHLLREVEDLAKENPQEMEVQTFTAALIPLLAQAQHLRAQAISDRQYYKQSRQIKEKIIATSQQPSRHLGIRRLQDIFTDNPQRLYHWVENRRLPAENNLSERELRPTVIARKVSFGSQSDAGAKSRETLMSVLHSLRKRVEQPKKRLKEVLDRIARGEGEEVFKMLFATDSS
jgi:transposase